MRELPLSIGTLHFIGIGGIGMSGIAEVLHHLGYSVSGSDSSDNANVQRLRAQGIRVAIGHKAEQVQGVSVVVYSSAVKRDNPELAAARALGLPVVRRAEMLAELMRLKWSVAVAGTHGKTTTTSLVGWLFEKAGLDPTIINGGIINAYGANTRQGGPEWMVVEADESDGTFTRLPATIAVVTNIDPEHLDHYGTFDNVRLAFENFVQNIPFYGFGVLCVDHPEVQSLIPRVEDRRIITYGFSPQADIRAVDVRQGPGGARYSVVITDRAGGTPRVIDDIQLPMFGLHNIQNSLVCVAIAHQMNIPEAVLRETFASFQGVKRRFTKTGSVGGITVIDDYGHHPVEISAVLKAARVAGTGRTIAVVQPHRYSRLESLFEQFCTCFNDADIVLVADVYAAGEAPIAGADRDALVEGLRRHGHKHVLPLSSPEALPSLIHELAVPGDLVVCLGAGSITYWANALPAQLEALLAQNPQRVQG